MAPPQNARLKQTADIGRLVAEGRRRAKLSQEEFASRVGISRKTLSDLERGVADHVSLKTAIKTLSLAGFALEAAPRRPPTLSEVMARRAEHQARVDRLDGVTPSVSAKVESTARRGVPPKRRGIADKSRRR